VLVVGLRTIRGKWGCGVSPCGGLGGDRGLLALFGGFVCFWVFASLRDVVFVSWGWSGRCRRCVLGHGIVKSGVFVISGRLQWVFVL